MNDSRQYNPLSIEELSKSAVRKLVDYPSVELPPANSFDGVGVYTIHYQGHFEKSDKARQRGSFQDQAALGVQPYAQDALSL